MRTNKCISLFNNGDKTLLLGLCKSNSRYPDRLPVGTTSQTELSLQGPCFFFNEEYYVLILMAYSVKEVA